MVVVTVTTYCRAAVSAVNVKMSPILIAPDAVALIMLSVVSPTAPATVRSDGGSHRYYVLPRGSIGRQREDVADLDRARRRSVDNVERGVANRARNGQIGWW